MGKVGGGGHILKSFHYLLLCIILQLGFSYKLSFLLLNLNDQPGFAL